MNDVVLLGNSQVSAMHACAVLEVGTSPFAAYGRRP